MYFLMILKQKSDTKNVQTLTILHHGKVFHQTVLEL